MIPDRFSCAGYPLRFFRNIYRKEFMLDSKKTSWDLDHEKGSGTIPCKYLGTHVHTFPSFVVAFSSLLYICTYLVAPYVSVMSTL